MSHEKSRSEPEDVNPTQPRYIVRIPRLEQAFQAALEPATQALRDIAAQAANPPALTRFSETVGELAASQTIHLPTPDLSYLAPRLEWTQFTNLSASIARIAETLRAALPGNWRDGGFEFEDMPDVIREGVPLAWVPPADVIADLLAAPDAAARVVILEAARDAIVDGCRQVLTEVTAPELGDQVRLLQDCVEMMAGGKHTGAQALAAGVWDTVYRGVWRAEPQFQSGTRFAYKKVNAKLPPIDDEGALIDFRVACVLGPFVKACEDFYEDSAVPAAFNRHATVHATGPTQFTVANALVALMLAVSLIRELQEGVLTAKIHS